MTTTESNVTLKFPIFLGRETGGWFSTACDGFCYGSEAKAKTHFRTAIEKNLTRLIQEDGFENRRMAMVACGDGTVLLVRRQHESWGYVIAGPERKYLGSGVMGDETYDVALDRARKHAAECFGGVAWEN